MIKNIVFSGAGLKCWAYIGTLHVLDDHKDIFDIEHVVGVSAGSIFGLFYILGFKWDFLLDYFMNLNFQEMCDIDIDNILTQQSIFAGLKFKFVIKELMSKYIDPDITFKELRYYSKIKFTVNALNITDSVLEYFNYELTPDVKIIDAIMASSRLPLILPPYQINGKLYYDGGLCNNCPVDFTEEVNTIAFTVSCKEETNNGNFIINLINSLVKIANNTTTPKESYNMHNILDERFKDEMININQTRDDIFNIYMHGYINSKNIIFKNCIALPAP